MIIQLLWKFTVIHSNNNNNSDHNIYKFYLKNDHSQLIIQQYSNNLEYICLWIIQIQQYIHQN